MSLSSIVHEGLSKQVMEEAISYDQKYIPWNPPPYQHHAPKCNAYQSNGFEDVESLNHGEVHECIEEVEEENEDQEVEDVDQEVEKKDVEPKGIENVYSASSEATSPKLPSELHFEWVNPSDMNFLGPQHYGLLEMDGQLKALCVVLDKKKMDSMELDESRFKSL
ncbi:hypothetical protein PIB30_076091 [Stylosanthes scabra]|uniref:Uncharacterized protein n=1 Tax=Stylosanthes scabra TaxID=79078 RepID=A0ABU6UTU7_9FABA|nr:hypothetical protein [Stylosanthes scabra]